MFHYQLSFGSEHFLVKPQDQFSEKKYSEALLCGSTDSGRVLKFFVCKKEI